MTGDSRFSWGPPSAAENIFPGAAAPGRAEPPASEVGAAPWSPTVPGPEVRQPPAPREGDVWAPPPGAPAGWRPLLHDDPSLRRRPVPLARPNGIGSASKALVVYYSLSLVLTLGLLAVLAIGSNAAAADQVVDPNQAADQATVHLGMTVLVVSAVVSTSQVLLGWLLARGAVVAGALLLPFHALVALGLADRWMTRQPVAPLLLVVQAIAFAVSVNVVVALSSPTSWRWLRHGVPSR